MVLGHGWGGALLWGERSCRALAIKVDQASKTGQTEASIRMLHPTRAPNGYLTIVLAEVVPDPPS